MAEPATTHAGLLLLHFSWVPAWSLLGLLVWSCARDLPRPADAGKPLSLPGWRFPALLGLSLLAFRWPSFFHGFMNPDESVRVAAANTLWHDPRYWLSVDGLTSGPLNDYPLLWPRLFGLRVDYFNVRITTLLMTWVALLACVSALRRRLPEAAARCGMLPGIAFFAFTEDMGLIHYASEYASLTLCCLAGAALYAGLPTARAAARPFWLVLAGLCVAAAPFAKPQAAPIAAWIGLWGCGATLLTPDPCGSAWFRRTRACAWLLGGGAFFGLALLAYLLLADAFPDFYQSYVVNNLAYAERVNSIPEQLQHMLLAKSPLWRPFMLPVAALGAAVLLALPFRRARRVREMALFSAGSLAAAAFAILSTGRSYEHYLLYLVAPTCMLAASALAWALGEGGPRGLAALALCGACLLPQAAIRAQQPDIYNYDVRRYPDQLTSPVSQRIMAYAGKEEAMAVWGWMPDYLVQTGLRLGTREAETERQLKPGPQREYYRARYLQDIRRNTPAIFLDAVGGHNYVFRDRGKHAHETFPELASFIAERYALVGELDGCRIYARNDKLPIKSAVATALRPPK